MTRPRLATPEGALRCLDTAAVCLVLALLLVKAWFLATLKPPAQPVNVVWAYVRSLVAITYADALFVAAIWAAIRILVAPLRRLPRIRAAAVLLTIALFAFVCVYAVANLVVFGLLGGFLTYPLLSLIGNVRMLSSSVAANLTPRVLVAIVGLPLAYLALVAAMLRVVPPASSRRWRRPVAAAMLLACWTVAGHAAFFAWWQGRAEWRVADNAPWVFASSWWSSAHERATVTLSDVFPPSHLDDFLRFGQRLRSSGAASVRRVSSITRVRRVERPRRPPNVIFVVLESVATRWTSLPGGSYDTTPSLKAALGRSVAFENFYAHTGRSSSSLYAMLLSAYPKIDFRDITTEYPRAPGTSLPSLFHEQGYSTAMVTSSDLSWAGWDVFLGNRGFDQLLDDHDLHCTQPLSSWGVEDRCMVDAMLDYIGRAGSRPFFLMGWTQQTHHPYEPTPGVPLLKLIREPIENDYDLGRYLNVLRETDHHLGRLFDGIERAGLADDTLVVIVGDHGQAFGYPHNTWMQGRTLYQEDVQVPLMFWFPRLYRAPARSAQVGSQVDLAPTVAQLAGLQPAPDWQGRSLFDATPTERAYFYVADDHFALGVREGDWKYIVDVRDGTEELYNLARDPAEQHNVAAAEIGRSHALRQRLAAFAEANRRQYQP